jgi:hypothetical protein
MERVARPAEVIFIAKVLLQKYTEFCLVLGFAERKPVGCPQVGKQKVEAGLAC